jgi:hypothetical protein
VIDPIHIAENLAVYLVLTVPIVVYNGCPSGISNHTPDVVLGACHAMPSLVAIRLTPEYVAGVPDKTSAFADATTAHATFCPSDELKSICTLPCGCFFHLWERNNILGVRVFNAGPVEPVIPGSGVKIYRGVMGHKKTPFERDNATE